MILLFFPLFLFALTISNISNKEFNISKPEKIKIINSENITLNFVKRFEGKINIFNFIKINNSKNIYIKNLYIKSNSFYNAIINIKNVDKKRKIICFDVSNQEKVNLRNNLSRLKYIKLVYLVKLKENRISRKVSKIIKIEKNKFYYKKFPFSKKGTYALIFRYKIPVVNIFKSENVYFNNFTLNTSPNIVFLIRDSKNLYFNKIKIIDFYKRGITSNADIFHCANIKGDFKLTNSYFEYVSDDVINIYTKALKVDCKKNICKFKKKYELSDILYVYNVIKGDLKKIKSGKIFLYKNLIVDNNQIYVKNNINVLIKNNIFKNSRRFGVLIRNSGKNLIINNYFENLSGDAITFFNSPKNKEGLFSNNILIKNNTIKHCALSKFSKAAISIYALKKGRRLVDNKVFFKNVFIKNNILISNKKNFFLRNISNFYMDN